MSKTDLSVTEDKIGQEVKVGSIVAMPETKSLLKIGRVLKISPKTLLIQDVNGTSSNSRWDESRKKHKEVICLDEMEATVMYLMTRNL